MKTTKRKDMTEFTCHTPYKLSLKMYKMLNNKKFIFRNKLPKIFLKRYSTFCKDYSYACIIVLMNQREQVRPLQLNKADHYHFA